MKTISFLGKAMTLGLLLFMTACSSDSDDSNNSNPANTTKTTFKLDGVLITADETDATLYNNALAG